MHGDDSRYFASVRAVVFFYLDVRVSPQLEREEFDRGGIDLCCIFGIILRD